MNYDSQYKASDTVDRGGSIESNMKNIENGSCDSGLKKGQTKNLGREIKLFGSGNIYIALIVSLYLLFTYGVKPVTATSP